MTKKKNLRQKHDPVLLKEVVDALRPEYIAHLHSDAQFIDATLGYGGHSSEIIRSGVFVLGIDADKEALEFANKKLSKACPTPQKAGGFFKTIHGNFRDLDKYANYLKLNSIYGILLDLGVSSPQLVSTKRGFSFQNPDAALDMRMDPDNQSVTAADLLNSLPEKELFRIFNEYLGFKLSKRFAKRIVHKRTDVNFKFVKDLMDLIDDLKIQSDNLNSATLPFMALRIAVNSEIENLREILPKAFDLLEKDGRMVIISFHSGEDKIVKEFFRDKVSTGQAIYPLEKLIKPSGEEVGMNPRSRSAKMRVIEKI